MAATTDPEKAIDRLYSLPLEEFIAARDALSKELRAAGDKEGAAQVKALRKPTAPAWAVNQLVRKQKKGVADLLDLGERMRKAQNELLSGRGAAAARELATQRRKLVDKLTKAAVGYTSEAQREAIAATLDAAVVSRAAADAVREGRLVKEFPAPSGFGDVDVEVGADEETGVDGGSAARERRRAARAARRGPAPASEPAADEPAADQRAEQAESDAERERLDDLIETARSAHEAAMEEARAAAHEAAATRAEVSRLQDELVTANGRAKAAQEKARVAQWRAAQAQQDLDAAERAAIRAAGQ